MCSKLAALSFSCFLILLSFTIQKSVQARGPKYNRHISGNASSAHMANNAIYIEHMNCSVNSSYIANYTCQSYRVAQERLSVTIKANLNRTCDNIFVHVQLFYLYENDERQLLNKWDDVCGYFAGESPSFLIDLLIDFFRKYSNINHTCPYAGEIHVVAERLAVNEIVTRNYIPTGKYRAVISLTNGHRRDFIGQVTVTFTNILRD